MISGVLFLDKPPGWTSRRAVNEVVRIFTPSGAKKIKAGHTGTLDPLATGMLPILLGEATRFAEMGLNAGKCYEVTFDLSFQTDSLDCEGEVNARFEGVVEEKQLNDLLDQFVGEQQQVPPLFSAIRVDGKRAHEIARSGKSVEMKARRVTVYDIGLIRFDFPLVTLRVNCSKGTYIRSLARDIGSRLGMGGCVTALRRLSTGGWHESLMVTMNELAERREACMMPLSQWLRDLPEIALPIEEGRRFLQGQRIQVSDKIEGMVQVSSEGAMLGTAELKPGLKRMVLHPARILPSAQEKLL
ncbi:MAG: tRNA pseudouridine(55) synthase TruB [Mariprofundaceae bacterium]|nr:tRNA pseudouridine(55) synthase TruB [Mariprofundaceae bacterium]